MVATKAKKEPAVKKKAPVKKKPPVKKVEPEGERSIEPLTSLAYHAGTKAITFNGNVLQLVVGDDNRHLAVQLRNLLNGVLEG